nr:hypothetical protein BaRGS_014454 [Batillaria attramentaria]
MEDHPSTTMKMLQVVPFHDMYERSHPGHPKEWYLQAKYFHKCNSSIDCHNNMQCNKALDSTSCNDHDGEIYCSSCYRKMFAPTGVSNLNQVQAGNVGGGGLGGGECCPRCNRTVYMAEKVIGAGKVYHKLCFKCNSCNKNLDSTLLTEHEDNIYCKACYSKNFGPKGFGYGTALLHSQ